MTNEQAASSSTSERLASERCLCREIVDRFEKVFDLPPAVREHLANSRVEFLKAVRAVIDQRIENLTARAQHGSHIAVE
jgi:hypothetical protein